jgi:ATP-dependent Clp protease ATP-binding subunit ClpA
MELHFRLLIRERPDGTVAAEALGLPPGLEVTAFETSREAAVAAVERNLKQQFTWQDRAYWAQAVFHEHQELRPVTVEVPLKGGDGKLPVTVNLLVTRHERPGGPRFLVTAPRVPGFQLVVLDPEAVEAEARPALARLLGGRKPAKALEAEVEGEEALASLTLELPGDDDEETESASSGFGGPDDEDDGGTEDVLALCGVNLTAQAAEGRLDPADRREALLERLLTVLSSDRRSSVLLVGAPDSGKTALVHELARRLAAGEVPEALRGRELWSVTANNLIAGMKYYGEWQGRAQELVRQVRAGRQLLYMGDPGEMLGAGRFRGSDNNIGRYLRPYMESGEVVVLCECSPEAYAALLQQEPSFIHTFQRIDVPPTGEADTKAILQAAARRLEAARGVRIEPGALAAVCDLTRRFMPYRAFPGKAMRLLEELVRDSLSRPEGGERPYGRAQAVAGFARATGLPEFILSDERTLRLAEVRTYFEERLLGQPEAVDAMVDLVTLLKAGLNDPQKPLGSFFFVGPTGVGKTEMAKVLAEYLFGSRDRMVRFDMSEYAAADALPRLIGSAWREDEGELTRRVREQPFCVVLLDEVEKAHAEVFDALLAVLGEGRLTDAGGRSADFRNAIIIMTSNLGASRRELHAIGFAPAASAEEEAAARLTSHFVKEAEAFFRPEFFNRIDRIVAFRPLTPEAVRRITRRELGKLLMREGIVRRSLLVEVDDAVIERLVERGFHPLYGARPLQREIERAVILPLARLLVEREADFRHLLRFTARDGEVLLSLVELESPEEAVAETVTPAERRLEADLAAVARAVEQLRARCAMENEGPLVQALRGESAALLARTREPTFWDDPAAAREVLKRVYQLERVLKRLDALAERAERLEERGQRLRRSRDRRAVPDLAQEAERLEDEFSYLQVELAGTAAGERHDRALVRVVPVGTDGEEWAAQLAAMYRAWAARKGYECVPLPGDGAADGGRRAGPSLPPGQALFVKGSNVYEFLRGEAGLHRLAEGSAEERRRRLARVSVHLPPPLPEDAEDAAAAGAAPERLLEALPRLLAAGSEREDAGEEPVARVYNQGRHRYVRDPRTGVRVNHVQAVLEEGQIDTFLLARLRQAVTAGGLPGD